MELLERVQALAFEFLALSSEQKEKAVSSLGLQRQAGASDSPPVQTLKSLKARSGHRTIRTSVMKPLAARIVELLALSLRLERTAFSGHFGSECTASIRFNHYPPCPQPSKTIGLGAHSDPGGVTIPPRHLSSILVISFRCGAIVSTRV